ncbi:MAG TPA: DUF1302 family protein [Myxococcota bacterium]|nr:DUF1302 family protein [Myxococcota bacterium]
MVTTSTRRGVCAALVALVTLAIASPARAIEALDGRLQLHGFFEEQVRAIDWDFKENMDLTQWYHVLDLEGEADILPDGWGPISKLSAYTRVEVRYDCVWTRACGLAASADVFGNRAEKLPVRLGDGRYSNLVGTSQGLGADPRRSQNFVSKPSLALGDDRHVGGVQTVPGLEVLFNTVSSAVTFNGHPYAPAFDTTFAPIGNYRFALRGVQGSENGMEIQTLGPWLPKNKIRPFAALAGVPNPFRPGDAVPGTTVVATGLPVQGSLALPYRPAPDAPFASGGDPLQARGVYYVSANAQHVLEHRSTMLDSFDQNFSQTQLEWNHGGSQNDEKELKEAYLDLELFDSRLLARLGKQTIVWGKTELFATTDQFNPRDLALASLPTLEESRIPLWAARLIYSFYNVGPLEDVRLETAINLDDFEPNDLGRCGEPYTPNPVCNKTAGLFAHGIAGYGVMGEDRPENWWQGWKGLQGGARLEFRWDRYSFAIADIYNYNALPYQHVVSIYERNVDPSTGRPREMAAHGPCNTGNEPACLTQKEAINKQSLNQQLFAMICSSSIGFSALDPTSCAQSAFNSQVLANGLIPVTTAITNVLGGSALGGVVLSVLAGAGNHLVPLNGGTTMSTALSVQQQALLGCGAFYATSCDSQGLDLLNAEASVVAQSWPGFDGTPLNGFRSNDPNQPQPGTVGFHGGPIATRYVNGRIVILPGARGPGDPGYNPAIDGIPDQVQPFTGQPFRSEMAEVSWNFLQLLVALSAPPAGQPAGRNRFDSANQFRTDGCSFAVPQFCSNLFDFYTVTGNRRQTIDAGGNGRFGRRDFVWAGGEEILLRYDKRNILGFSMDFAEDVTKSNWSLESAWVEGNFFSDADKVDGITKASTFNLTVSIDRPTFINFLNPNHTFFFNTQLFFQYIPGYSTSFVDTLGPWNFLATFNIQTGYFQDRLLPAVTFVYDVKSNSGAALPQIEYRFTQSFSTTVGVSTFMGRFQNRKMYLEPASLLNQAQFSSPGPYHTVTEQGIAPIRQRDEVFLRVRYTF